MHAINTVSTTVSFRTSVSDTLRVHYQSVCTSHRERLRIVQLSKCTCASHLRLYIWDFIMNSNTASRPNALTLSLAWFFVWRTGNNDPLIFLEWLASEGGVAMVLSWRGVLLPWCCHGEWWFCHGIMESVPYVFSKDVQVYKGGFQGNMIVYD